MKQIVFFKDLKIFGQTFLVAVSRGQRPSTISLASCSSTVVNISGNSGTLRRIGAISFESKMNMYNNF